MTEWASREQDIRRRAEIGGNISAKMAREVFAALDEARHRAATVRRAAERVVAATEHNTPLNITDEIAALRAALASPDSEP